MKEDRQMTWEEGEQLIEDSKKYLKNSIPCAMHLNSLGEWVAKDFIFTDYFRLFEWSDSPSKSIWATLFREGEQSVVVSLEDVVRHFERQEIKTFRQ